MEVNNKGLSKTVLFFGWQGSLSRHRIKYQELWEDLGFNCVSLGFRFDHLVNKFAGMFDVTFIRCLAGF